MKFPKNKNLKPGFVAAIILLIAINLVLLRVSDKIVIHPQTEKVSIENISNLENIYFNIIAVEKSYQTYLTKPTINLLSNYKYGKIALSSSLNKIDSSIDNVTILKVRNTLKSEIQQVIKIFDKGISEFEYANGGVTDSIRSTSHQGSSLIDSIKNRILTMQISERYLLYKNATSTVNYFNIFKIINIFLLLITILFSIFSFITFSFENKERKNKEDEVVVYKKFLAEKTLELNNSNIELKEIINSEKFAASGRMARMIAHEIRNPLTNIGLANDQLKDAIESNEENLMLMGMIKRNGERINYLVGELLNATKFVELNLSEISINDLLDEVLLTAQPKIDLSNTKVTKNYSPLLSNVLVDADKIKVAFLHIINNAIEVIKQGDGEVKIYTSDNNNMCKVIISDNGEGMNKEVLSKLFEPFFTAKNKGNGLSLTITQNIILNHKGKINVSSELGKGSDFIIELKYA